MAINTARYCDGLAREFTAVMLDASGAVFGYAGVAGQVFADPLDCVALTEAEAHTAGRAYAAPRLRMIASDPAMLYRVVPLPAGWSND